MESGVPTKEDLDKLKRYVGRELTVTVHIDESVWDYGDIEHRRYDVDYRMKVESITADYVRGTLSEEKAWKHKDDVVVQRFSIFMKGTLPWEAGTTKVVTCIQFDDEILYDRRG